RGREHGSHRLRRGQGHVPRDPRRRPARMRLTSRSPLPAAGTQPFLIDWGESRHPAEASLPRLELLDFAIETPEVDATRSALEVLGAGDTRVVEGPEPRLRARMRGPGGVLEF